MERDFMGLTSKDTVVKEEALEGCKEPEFSKSSGVQWPLSNGLEAFNNRQAGEIQFAGSPVKRQSLGGAPVMSPHQVPPSTGSFVARTAEPWYGSKAAPAPAQLTIFYGGMVNVYDDISSEKAQAIMFLAGNGASVAAPNTPQPWVQAQSPNPITPAVDVSQPINTQPSSTLSSPMSVSSHPVGQLTGGPTNKDGTAKTMGGSTTSTSKADAPRVMRSLGPAMQSAIPQARKASLARFLEKRKERVMASTPYSLSKSSPDCVTNPGSSNVAVVVASERNK